MMKALIFCLLLIAASAAHSQVHDISADSVTILPKMSIGVPTPQSVWITNRGTAVEQQFGVTCVVRNKSGVVVYRDTQHIAMLVPSQSLEVKFENFTPLENGGYQVCGTILLAGDKNPLNDVSCAQGSVAYERDVQMLRIVTPKLNDSIVYGTSFRPKVQLRNVGVEDLFEIPVRYELRRKSDGVLVFRVDTTADAAFADTSITTALFPSVEGLYDTKRIPAGQYRAAAICRQKGDGDLSNDTAYSALTIYKDHDLSADSILAMPDTSILQRAIPIKARFSNHGLDEHNARVRFTITWQGQVQYCDTVTIASLASGASTDVPFQYFTAAHLGSYAFCAETLLPYDCDAQNNALCASFTEKIQHDLSAESFVNLPRRIAAGDQTAFTLRVKNEGWNDEKNGVATLIIRDSNANLVYNKNTTLTDCPFNDSVDVLFSGFTPASQGRYILTANISHPDDQFASNDSLHATVMAVSTNVEALAVIYPENGDTLPLHQSFIPIARFWNTGVLPISNTPAHMEIRRKSDDSVLVRFDVAITLLADSLALSVEFPSAQGRFNSANIPEGDYRVAAFADMSTPPDTAYSTFTIKSMPQAAVTSLAKAQSFARIFPNPCNGVMHLTIASAEPSEVRVEIIDMIGRIIRTQTVSNVTGDIPLTLDLPAGHYEAVIHADGWVQVLPIVVTY
jgi:hypothetical protein